MTKPIVTEHNSQTGEVISREYNDTELAQHNARLIEAAAALAEADTARTAAVAKLAKLGLTVDDLQALGLGGN